MTLEEKMNELARDKIEEGFKVGSHKRSLEIAKAMKDEGFEIQQIVKLTQLTKEEIEKL